MSKKFNSIFNINRNNKGFTLAELLIVVAIIAVLVGISIPVFTTQLEKARDATSLANLRAAYAEASVAYITRESTGNAEFVDFDSDIIEGEDATLIYVHGVELKGIKSNNFSDNIDSLPFYFVEDDISGEHIEPDSPGKYNLLFDFDDAIEYAAYHNIDKVVVFAYLSNEQ